MGLNIQMTPEADARLRKRLGEEYGELSVMHFQMELVITDQAAAIGALQQENARLQALVEARDIEINAARDELLKHVDKPPPERLRKGRPRPVKKTPVPPSMSATEIQG